MREAHQGEDVEPDLGVFSLDGHLVETTAGSEAGVVHDEFHRTRNVGETRFDDSHTVVGLEIRDEDLSRGTMLLRHSLGERLEAISPARDEYHIVSPPREQAGERLPDTR
jgi:hypothetical protein